MARVDKIQVLAGLDVSGTWKGTVCITPMGLESSSFARIWGMADAEKVHKRFHLGCLLIPLK
jgi:hypothetical protein